MNKKIALQVLMLFSIVLISLLFYAKYLKKNNKESREELTVKNQKKNENSSANYIDDISYISSDVKGNKYQIMALQAELDINDQDVMFLENVTAYIFLKDSSIVKITSDYGKYNSKNYDTIFSKNVIIIYPEHKITGDYLDFSFLNNLGTVSRNVIYAGDKTKLFADKIEINITTKDTKIFMNDNTKKVLIKGIK